MRVVLDTNILVSALMVQTGYPAAVYRVWQEGYFTLLTCAEQLDELRATLRKPAIPERIKPYEAGRLVNEIKGVAEIVTGCRGFGAHPIRRTTSCWRWRRRAGLTTWLRAIRAGCWCWCGIKVRVL